MAKGPPHLGVGLTILIPSLWGVVWVTPSSGGWGFSNQSTRGSLGIWAAGEEMGGTTKT